MHPARLGSSGLGGQLHDRALDRVVVGLVLVLQVVRFRAHYAALKTVRSLGRDPPPKTARHARRIAAALTRTMAVTISAPVGTMTATGPTASRTCGQIARTSTSPRADQ